MARRRSLAFHTGTSDLIFTEIPARGAVRLAGVGVFGAGYYRSVPATRLCTRFLDDVDMPSPQTLH